MNQGPPIRNSTPFSWPSPPVQFPRHGRMQESNKLTLGKVATDQLLAQMDPTKQQREATRKLHGRFIGTFSLLVGSVGRKSDEKEWKGRELRKGRRWSQENKRT